MVGFAAAMHHEANPKFAYVKKALDDGTLGRPVIAR